MVLEFAELYTVWDESIFCQNIQNMAGQKMLQRKKTSVPFLEYSYMFSRIFIASGIFMTVKSAALT